MKALFLALAVVLAVGVAQAMPAVGDSVTTKVTISNVTTKETISYNETIKFTGYNATTKEFDFSYTITVGDVTDTQKGKVAAATLVTDALIADFMSKCAEKNGIKETVTVAGKSLEVCKVSNAAGNQAWVGAVPLAYVYTNISGKNEQGQVVQEIVEVTDFTLGK